MKYSNEPIFHVKPAPPFKDFKGVRSLSFSPHYPKQIHRKDKAFASVRSCTIWVRDCHFYGGKPKSNPTSHKMLNGEALWKFHH